MTKEFLIAGPDWIAEVPINEEDIGEQDVKIEAATRALEGRLHPAD